MVRKKGKVVIRLMIVCLMSTLLVSCDEKIQAQISTDLSTRAMINIEYIRRLQDNGLLSKDAADAIVEDIQEKLKTIKKITGKEKELTQYISWYIKGEQGINGETFTTTITNNMRSLEETFESTGPLVGKENRYVNAINVIGGTHIQALQDVVNYEEWGLGALDGVTLGEVVSIVDKFKSAINNSDTTTVESIYNNFKLYFNKKLKDRLVDEPLIITTKLGTMQNYSIPINGEILNVKAPSIISNNSSQALGYDFRIRGSYDFPEMTIRLEEINPIAVNKLVGLDGIARDEYLVYNRTVYKLKYPIYRISDIVLDNVDKDFYEANIRETGFYLNLMTGEITDEQGYPFVQSEDIIKLGKGNELDTSSFVIYDGKIVLRDYLEFHYVPGIVEGEKWVALGRRVRINRFSGNIKDPIGSILNRDGTINETTSKIYPMDLVSYESGYRTNDGLIDYSGIAIKLGEGESESSESRQSNVDGDSLIQTVYRESITPVMKFGGGNNFIATQDKDAGTKGKILLFGICVDRNPFIDGLYKSWISSNDEVSGGLAWWLNWLRGNRYNYTINTNVLTQYLTDNYSFELRKAGVIVLDTDVIKKIQQQYDLEDKERRVNSVRTVFIVLGFALIAYSIILLASWAVDVSLVADSKFMALLTLNKWEAIKDGGEIPLSNMKGKHYMTFSATFRSCCVIMMVGILFIFVDVLKIVYLLIDTFGSIADIITQVIFGNK